jgi:hypothetical protein
VGTPGDFGSLGERPTHPELLDWLAVEFMRNGWRLKPLHKMIVTSAVYRQSSQRRDDLDAIDPDNALLGRMSARRLESETIRDAILSISGRLTNALYGPPVPVMPDDVGQIVVGVDTRDSAGRPTGKVVPLGTAEFRRSVYIQVRRSMPLGMLQTFDAPLMTPNCERRVASTVSPQALFMMNSAFIDEQAKTMAHRVERETSADLESQFRRAWRLAFGESPTDRNVRDGLVFLNRQTMAADSAGPAARGQTVGPGETHTAFAHLCQALLISNGLLYVD